MVRELSPKDNQSDSPQTLKESDATPVDLLRYIVGGFCVLAILLFSASYTVREGRQVVVLRFGEAVRVIEDAGLHFKAPWPIERLSEVDRRSRAISTPQTELLTRDKKNIVLITGGAWRPSDPVLFHRSVGSLADADEKINGLIVNATISAFGRYDLSALVSTDPDTLKVESLEDDIQAAVNDIARNSYGIEVVHIGFQRVLLPEQNVEFVLEQMRAERRQFASRFRADGELEAARIRSAADLEAARIVAAAREQATQILGAAEAEAAGIYASAHEHDPDFYRFVRSLEGLERTLDSAAWVTLRTDAEPFTLLVTQGSASPSNRPMPADASDLPPAFAASSRQQTELPASEGEE